MNKEQRIKAAELAYPEYPNDSDQLYSPFRSGDVHCHKKRKAFIKGAEAEAESNKAVPYQSCPICLGNGKVLAPQCTSTIYNTCDVCNGAKIIPMYTPPLNQQ